MNLYKLYDFVSKVEYPLTLFLALLVFCLYLDRKKWWFITIPSFFVVIELYWSLIPIPYPVFVLNYLLIFGLVVLMLKLSIKYNLYQIVFLTTCGFAVQHLSYKINLSIIFLIGFQYWHSWWYFLCYLFVILGTNTVIYFLFARYFKRDRVIRVNSITVLFIGFMVVISTIFLSFYTQENLANEANRYNFVQVNCYSIFLCITSLIILFSNTKNLRLKEENVALEALLSKDKDRYELAKISSEKINIKYHDLKHQLLNPNLTEEQKEEIRKDGALQSSMYFTNNKALDIVLMEKNLLCQKKNIQLTAICDGALLSFIKSYQIYSLFGNLLDNAIEALEKVQDANKRTIKVDVRRVKNNILIETENFTTNNITFEDGLPKTTSKDDKENHGFGMKSIKNIVDEYHGLLRCELNNEMFKVKIVFPMSE